MKKILLLAMLLNLTACATIIDGQTADVKLTSMPSDVEVTITNEDQEKVFVGKTPVTVSLERGNGYFDGQTYNILLEKSKYVSKLTELDTEINPWYFGNLVCSYIIGMLIVDPLSGAMWDLPEDVFFTLDRK